MNRIDNSTGSYIMKNNIYNIIYTYIMNQIEITIYIMYNPIEITTYDSKP